MADVTISYKGESIATMDASGTKTLNTSGKYCEGDITVQYADPEKPTQTKSVTPSESAQTVTPDSGKVLSSVSVGAVSSTYVGSGVTRKAAQTYTPTTTDQTIAAGQYLSGTQTVKGDANLVAGNIKSGVSIFGVTGTHSGGTTPSGSVTITENGTYDVTDKASAVVELPYVYKRWVYTNSSLISDTQTITLLTDSWLAQHYDSAKLDVMVTALNPPQADDTGNVYYSTTRARNATLGAGKSIMQIITRVGGSGGSYSASAAALQGKSPTTRGMLRLDSSGNLMLRVDSQCKFAAGDYEIVARLIP